jgi:hypothetical protein
MATLNDLYTHTHTHILTYIRTSANDKEGDVEMATLNDGRPPVHAPVQATFNDGTPSIYTELGGM